jgi:hypothetical protein
VNFSIKNTLVLWLLYFTCSFLHGAETIGGDLYLTKYQFYENADCIKVKIVLPVGKGAESTLYKINNPDSKRVAVHITNDSLERLETFYQLVDIEVHAVSSQEEGGVTFEIVETLEKKPTDGTVLKDTLTTSSKYFVKTDKQVDFRDDILPKLTVSRDSPHIKYVRFFTKSYRN